MEDRAFEIQEGKDSTMQPGTPTDLLNEFISQKLENYEEPKREGKRKGEKIGFSLDKYSASLFVGLTNIDPRKIAKLIGTTPGMVWFWKTRKDFQEMAKRHAKEFASILLQELFRLEIKEHEAFSRYEIGKPNDPDLVEEIYRIWERVAPCIRLLGTEVILYFSGPSTGEHEDISFSSIKPLLEELDGEEGQMILRNFYATKYQVIGFHELGADFEQGVQIGLLEKSFLDAKRILENEDPLSDLSRKRMHIIISNALEGFIQPQKKYWEEKVRARILNPPMPKKKRGRKPLNRGNDGATN